MNKWKKINTLSEIPNTRTWNRDEWQGTFKAGRSYDMPVDPRMLQILVDGRILNINDDYIAYRPKPFPTNDYIRNHLWIYNDKLVDMMSGGAIADMWESTNLYNPIQVKREWFLTASHVAKSDMRSGLKKMWKYFYKEVKE